MPHTFGSDGPSSLTPQRNRFPIWLASSSTFAVKPGQPSSARPGVMGVSLHTCESLPKLSQLPASLALRNISRLSPVKYLKRTVIFAIAGSVCLADLNACDYRDYSSRPEWRIQTKSLNLTNECLNGVMRWSFSKTNYA